MAGVRRISAATSLHPASGTPPGRASHHEASTKVQAIHPSGLPLARRRPDGTSSRFGFPPSFAPRRPEPDDARRGGDRPTEHGPGTTLYDISRSSNRACSLITCDVVVATTRVRVSRALRSWARKARSREATRRDRRGVDELAYEGGSGRDPSSWRRCRCPEEHRLRPARRRALA